MGRLRYTAGQIVTVAPTSLSGPSTRDAFRVVRRYPISNRPDLYWLQSLADPSQRMTAGGELSCVAPSAEQLNAPGTGRWMRPSDALLELSAAA